MLAAVRQPTILRENSRQLKPAAETLGSGGPENVTGCTAHRRRFALGMPRTSTRMTCIHLGGEVAVAVVVPVAEYRTSVAADEVRQRLGPLR
jgi:hypothetical protein